MLLGDRETDPALARIGSTADTVAVVTSSVGAESAAAAAPAASQAMAAPVPVSGVTFLLTEGDTLAAVVVLQAGGPGVISLGIPTDTLVRTSDGFKSVSELHKSGDIETLPAGLETILGAVPAQVGTVSTEALRKALQEAGLPATLPSEGEAGPEGAREAAEVVLQLAHLAATDDGVWEALSLEGDAPAIRATIAELAASSPDSVWQTAVLPGRQVVGDEFGYYEADVAAARLLLKGGEPGTEIALEVQNGSGAVGAAEAAAALLAPLGFTSLPFSNAPGFPDVETTVVSAAPGTLSAAHQMRTLLGVGEVAEDESLPSGRVVVVVGKDFVPPASANGSWGG